jgi:hypothetical protein
MTGVFERLEGFVQNIAGGQIALPKVISIPPAQCFPTGSIGAEIRKDQAYFTVQINELFLQQARQWFVTYDPMVLITTTFVHGDKTISVPAVVGPSLIAQPGHPVPQGIVLHDTTVAGPYPYRGGPVAISVVLYRVRHKDHARALLKVVESVSKAIGPAADMGLLSKVGGSMLDGLEVLLSLGETEPIAGHRIELSPLRRGGFRSLFSALINTDNVAIDTLRVEDGRLGIVSAGDTIIPYTSADYVLYSIESSDRRTDERTLPFYSLYRRALQDAARGDEEAWKSAKATLAELWQQLILSPDILRRQADDLLDTYRQELLATRQRAMDSKLLSPAETRPVTGDGQERTRRAAMLLEM